MTFDFSENWSSIKRGDLVRCGKLFERVKAYNPKATGLAEHHKLRPIPQAVHIDRLVNPGSYSDEQNPGY